MVWRILIFETNVLHISYHGLDGYDNVFYYVLKAGTDKGMDYKTLFYGTDD